ncbi:response regulator [Novosphingobium sp. JCM 18896]|uniref:response regulator n=1 Tax=Novosphingobium sp. JCM 18896 TaxID=2989731 RepID=UPI002221A858|nr:response regulator [Novosphingobium sp. JCM 18896]MCW1429474.1 response regulator [Novosphingobium sp. JCM 18896]
MTYTNVSVLQGLRILVVEDEPLLAMALVDEIEELGARVIGPVASLEGALDVIGTSAVDAAILDVELQKKLVYPVADRLVELGVPFVLTSGHDAAVLPERYADVPHSAKPAPAIETLRLLAGLISPR